MTGGIRRAPGIALAAIAIALAISITVQPAAAQGDDTARASTLFASGNGHLQAAQRARGDRRTRELEAALADYTSALGIVRSRNILFNASVAAEQLGRLDEAFNHMVEYLAVPGLSDTERTEAERREVALRAQVAVLSIDSAPTGAEVWIDRRDLAARGHTPLVVAVPAGDHQLWLRAPGHREAQARATTITGRSAEATITLEPEPVRLQVLAPTEHRLLLDGQPISAGAMLQIAPGPHVIRLEVEGFAPIERRVEIPAGAAPMVIDLAGAVAGLGRRSDATLVVTASEPAQVLVDGLVVGSGSRLEIPVAEGEHEIRVSAEGRAPFRAQRAFRVGDRAELRVDLLPQGGSLNGARVAFGVLASLGLAMGVVSTVAVVDAHDHLCQEPGESDDCAARAEANNTWALVTDVSWIATAALGVTELVLLLIDDGGASESRGDFALAPVPLPGGAGLAARFTLGGDL